MRKVAFLWALALILASATLAFGLDAPAPETESPFDARAYLGIDDLPFPGEGAIARCDPTLNPCEDDCCRELESCLSGCQRCQYQCFTQFRNCEATCHGGGWGFD